MGTVRTNSCYLDIKCFSSSGMQFSGSHQLQFRESRVTSPRRLEEEKNKGFIGLSHHHYSVIFLHISKHCGLCGFRLRTVVSAKIRLFRLLPFLPTIKCFGLLFSYPLTGYLFILMYSLSFWFWIFERLFFP